MLLALLPALLAGCLHWLLAPTWVNRGAVALSLFCLAYYSRERRALWLWAWVLSQWISGVPLISGGVPLLYLALLNPPRERLYRILTLLGALIASHAVISFLAFRWAGGTHGWRPDILQPWLQALVWPYYCGHYPRGAHAVGLFLNDNLLGVWCVAILCLPVTRKWLRIPLLLAIGWSYSRSAYLSLLGACASRDRRLVLLPLLIPVLFLGFATDLDRWRFSADWASTLGGRMERLHEFLSHPSQLGQGPVGLVDSQWLKTGLELGWLGLCIQLGFCLSVLRAARGGLQAALIALLLGGVGCEIWESPHLAGTFFLLSACTRANPPRTPDAPAADTGDSRNTLPSEAKSADSASSSDSL